MNGLSVGWLKMFEERFGRFGRPLTTVLLSLGVLAFAAGATTVIYLLWGRPLVELGSKLLGGNDVSAAAKTLLAYMVTTALPIVVLWLLWKFYFSKKWEDITLRVAVTGQLLSSTREQAKRLDTELKAVQEQTQQELANTSQSATESITAILDMISRVLKLIEDDHTIRSDMETRISKLEAFKR